MPCPRAVRRAASSLPRCPVPVWCRQSPLDECPSRCSYAFAEASQTANDRRDVIERIRRLISVRIVAHRLIAQSQRIQRGFQVRVSDILDACGPCLLLLELFLQVGLIYTQSVLGLLCGAATCHSVDYGGRRGWIAQPRGPQVGCLVARANRARCRLAAGRQHLVYAGLAESLRIGHLLLQKRENGVLLGLALTEKLAILRVRGIDVLLRLLRSALVHRDGQRARLLQKPCVKFSVCHFFAPKIRPAVIHMVSHDLIQPSRSSRFQKRQNCGSMLQNARSCPLARQSSATGRCKLAMSFTRRCGLPHSGSMIATISGICIAPVHSTILPPSRATQDEIRCSLRRSGKSNP